MIKILTHCNLSLLMEKLFPWHSILDQMNTDSIILASFIFSLKYKNVLLFFSFPTTESLNTIYHSILSQHFANPEHKVPSIVSRLCPNVVAASINLHHKVSQLFLPTASKFHYIFNLRDISNAFQVCLVYIFSYIFQDENWKLWLNFSCHQSSLKNSQLTGIFRDFCCLVNFFY